MQVKAGDGVDHRLVGEMDRRLGRQAGEHLGQLVLALGIDQQRDHPLGRVADEGPQHRLALGDEQALAADEVAFLDRPERRDGGIVGIGDDAKLGQGGL